MDKRQKSNQLALLQRTQSEIDKSIVESSSLAIASAKAKLFDENVKILETYMKFHELGFGEDGEVDESQIPFEWEGLSREEKAKKIRLAKCGWMNSADTPNGIKVAHATVLGIIKATAVEQSGSKTLNIETVSFPQISMEDNTKEDVIDVED